MAALQLDDTGVITVCSNCGQKNRVAFDKLGRAARCGQCKQDVRAGAVPLEVGSTADFDRLVSRSAVPIIVDYWAPWCGPCRLLGPVIEQIAEERSATIKVGKVNVDEEPVLADRGGVRGIPFVVLYRDGEPIAHAVGAQPKDALERTLGLDSALVTVTPDD